MIINVNDIIIVENLEPEHDGPGKVQFLRLRHAWRVDDITNGGKIHAHDAHGRPHLIHALDKPPCYPYIVRVREAK